MFHAIFIMDKHKPKVALAFMVAFFIVIGFLLFLGRNWGLKEQQKDPEEMDKNIVTEELYRK